MFSGTSIQLRVKSSVPCYNLHQAAGHMCDGSIQSAPTCVSLPCVKWLFSGRFPNWTRSSWNTYSRCRLHIHLSSVDWYWSVWLSHHPLGKIIITDIRILSLTQNFEHRRISESNEPILIWHLQFIDLDYLTRCLLG